MVILYCNLEWREAANRSSRNGAEQVLEPPGQEELENEMRKDSKLYIQFVTRMLPPVCGKETWIEVSQKTRLSTFVTASQEAFALLLYKNGYEAWSWMQSDSSSDGDETGTEKQPNFKYTSRTETHVMARNS